MDGVDFRDELDAYNDTTYSTYLYGNETLRILREHVAEDSDDPFFLYVASQAVHTPWSAPSDIIDSFNETISDPDRRKLAAVTTVLDETVGQIIDYMKSEESGYLWDNTLIIVSSDNGGEVTDGAVCVRS